jgi:hypothetical protein
MAFAFGISATAAAKIASDPMAAIAAVQAAS